MSVEPEAPDWQALQAQSLVPGGFGARRADIWPRLLHAAPPHEPCFALVDSENAVEASPSDSEKSGPLAHPDEYQIHLDTQRSFVLYPVGKQLLREREVLQTRLHDLLVSIFRRHHKLNYFQGYHDIITVLLLTLPPEMQLVCAEKLSLQRLRDSMGSSLEPVLGLLRIMRSILRLADPAYARLLEGNSPFPYYALSNLLTLFSHDMPTLPLIQHVFDYLLCRPPILSVYLAAAIVLSRKEEAQRLEEEGEEGMVHSLLSGLPDLFEEDQEAEEEETPPPPLKRDDDLITAQDITLVEPVQDGDNKVVLDPDGGHRKSISEDTLNASSADLGSSLSTDDDATLKDEDLDGVLRDADTSDIDESINALPDAPKNVTSRISDLPDMDERVHTREASPSGVDKSTAGSTDAPKDLALGISPPPKVDEDAQDEKPTSIPSQPLHHPHHPQRARLSLSSLLRKADDLYTLCPPTHPAIDAASVMGPRSVIFTWSPDPHEMPNDAEAEDTVEHLEQIVLPYVEPPSASEEDEDHDDDKAVRKRPKRGSKLVKRRVRLSDAFLLERRTVYIGSAVAIAVLAVAVVACRGRSCALTGGSARFGGWVAGTVVGLGDRIVDGTPFF